MSNGFDRVLLWLENTVTSTDLLERSFIRIDLTFNNERQRAFELWLIRSICENERGI